MKTTRWLVVSLVFAGIVIFGGNPQDPWLWAYVVTFVGLVGYMRLRMDPELAKERFTPPSQGADRLSLATVRLVAMAHLVVGVLDARYRWTEVPDGLRLLGLAGFVTTFLLVDRAMTHNKFFSTVVRVQSERGHRVVDTGPYAAVRHPGYAGMILLLPLSGLALGSWLSVAAAFAYSALILRRVLFEDRFLHANLEGYASYAGRVRYRLLPGVW